MNENSVLNIEAKYKIKKRFEPCVAVSINIYNVDSEENETKIGSIKTDANGQAVYIIPNKYIAEKSNFIVKLEKDKIY